MRLAWIAGCLLVLAACSKKETASAVDLSVQYKGYVPKCLRVTAADAKAPEAHTSSDTLDKDKLAEHADPADRTVRIAVFREKSWSQELKIDVASYSTEDCGGTPVETRGLASVTLPAKGRVTPEPIQLLAKDADGDGYIAETDDSAIQQDTDCDDTADHVYPGAKPKVCGLEPDPTSDFDCDKVPECAQQPDGETCAGSAMCKSGFCVAGICCVSACDTPPDTCRGSPTCGGGTCNYPIVVDKSCDDGDKCTTVDTCNAQGQCVGSAPVTCPTRSDACLSPTGTCVPSDGGCYYPPLAADTVCDDSNGCTAGEKCDGLGNCAGGTVKVCNSSTPGWPTQCYSTTGTCIPADGGCVFPEADAGTACNDSDSCTHSDQCNAGACVSTAYSCTGGNECQLSGASACAGDGNCVYASNPAKDGQACNLGSSQSGTCLPGAGKCSSFPYVPSNFDPDVVLPAQIATLPSVSLPCNVTFDSSTLTWTPEAGCPAFTQPNSRLYQQPGGPQVVILSMKQFDIAATKTLTLVGDKPVIFSVYGSATLDGKILANALMNAPGVGGNWSNCGTRAGQSGIVGDTEVAGGGGGGGGLGSTGGNGNRGDTNSTGGTGGTALATTHILVPLVGGCQGGAGGSLASTGGLAGAGGGAFQISVSGMLTVNDSLSVSGGGGTGGNASASEAGGGGGGGSGGGLLLEAATLSISANAKLTANGGGGGQGGKMSSAKGEDGSNGPTDTNTQALGGNTGGIGGNGGKGGAGTTNPSNGATGSGSSGGGGGGGGVGRIRLVGSSACTVNGSSVISPPYVNGGVCSAP